MAGAATGERFPIFRRMEIGETSRLSTVFPHGFSRPSVHGFSRPAVHGFSPVFPGLAWGCAGRGTSAAEAGEFLERLNRSGKPLRHPKTLSWRVAQIRMIPAELEHHGLGLPSVWKSHPFDKLRAGR